MKIVLHLLFLLLVHIRQSFPDAVEQAIGVRPPLPDHLSDLYDRKEIYTVIG